MRSRYSAFVLDLRPHLLATWHPDKRPAAIEPPEAGLKWLGLAVSQSAAHPLAAGEQPPGWAASLSGPPLQAWGEVRFVARHKMGGRAHRLAEHSGFVQQGGHWLYVCALPE
jgi:SEC-C motif-containing protein